jgi:hypothetical protein
MTSSASARLRRTRRYTLMVLPSAAALSMAALLMVPGVAQAQSARSVMLPVPAGSFLPSISTQQMQPWEGVSDGQTVNSDASYAGVLCVGSTVYVSLELAQTDLPNADFSTGYKLDGNAPIPTGKFFRTNAQGTGFAGFRITDVPAGSHNVVVEVNNNPPPGYTYYISAGANNGSAYPGIPFSCQT